jgi:hypothetical protein
MTEKREAAIIMAADDLAKLSRAKISLWTPDIPAAALRDECPPIPPVYLSHDFGWVHVEDDASGQLSSFKPVDGVNAGATMLIPERHDTAHSLEVAEQFNFMWLTKFGDYEEPVLEWVFSVPRRWRRYAPVPVKHIVMAAQAEFHDDEITFVMEFAHYANGVWYRSGAKQQKTSGLALPRCGQISLMYGAALDARYKASLCLREPGQSGLFARICAPLPEIRALLKNRDIGNLPRRPSLLHNVQGHLRRKNRQNVRVSEHFRGAHRCSWLGLDAYLIPSEYDCERLHESVVAQQCQEVLASALPSGAAHE